VSLADIASEGFNVRSTDMVLRDNDAYDNTTVHAKVGVKLNEQWRSEFAHRRVDADTDFDDCDFFAPVHDCMATYQLTASRAALTYQGSSFQHSLAYSQTDSVRDSLSKGVSSFASEGTLERIEYVGSLNAATVVDLVFGADWEEASMRGWQRNNAGAFFELLAGAGEPWLLSVGLRHDANDDFGNNNSFRIGAAYAFSIGDSELRFKSSAGTGFRAPSLYEVSYNQGPWAQLPALGSRLRQESSAGWELGMELRTTRGARWEATWFEQRIDDAIEFDLLSYSGYLQARGRTGSKGLELAGTVPLHTKWLAQANLTWNDTVRPDGSPRLRRPRLLANLGLNWHASERLHLNAFVRMSRNSVDQDFAGIRKLDDFAVLDLNGTYQLNQRWQLYLRVENALDAKYQEVLGYHTAGLAAYVGARLHLAR
jgi:vitamin B12 transporter